MTLSDGTTRYAMAKNKIAIMFRPYANIYMGFIGSHGYGATPERVILFGTLHYLHDCECTKIRAITGVELLPI
jgi:hypothetical protein